MASHAPAQYSIFGGTERARVERTSTVRAAGYAAQPGTGPAGESCGSCAHCCAKVRGKTYYKCELMMAAWSTCRSTDVLVGSPACERWTAGTPRMTGVSKLRGG